MGDLKIRNIDAKLLEALKKRAKRHNRSLEAEVRQILSAAVPPTPPAPRVDLLALADQIAAMTPDVPQTDSADLLREDRDR